MPNTTESPAEDPRIDTDEPFEQLLRDVRRIADGLAGIHELLRAASDARTMNAIGVRVKP